MLDVRGIGVKFRAGHKFLFFKGSRSGLGHKCVIELALGTAFTLIFRRSKMTLGLSLKHSMILLIWTFLKRVDSSSVFVGPCHHGMARPQVADGITASDMEGSCE